MTARDDGAAPLRPILTADPLLRRRGMALGGGSLYFAEIAVRDGTKEAVLPAAAVAALHPEHAPLLARLSVDRGRLGDIELGRPLVVGVLDLCDDPNPAERAPAALAALVATGAGAVELLVRDPNDEALGAALRATAAVPLLMGGTAAAATAAGAAAWRPTAAMRAPGLRAVVSHPDAGLCFFALDRWLDRLAPHPADRSSLILEVAATAPEALARLAGLHGLGVAIMLDLDGPAFARAGPCAAAAAAVVAAGAGVALLRTRAVSAVAQALAIWRAANGLSP